MPLVLFYKNNETLQRIGTIELDALVQETQSFQQQATQFPVEEGVDIADHIRNEPEEITIEGVVSNFPIRVVENIDQALTQSAFANRANIAYEKLLDIRDRKAIVDVQSALRLFQNMVMTSLTIPRSNRTGDALKFSASFRQIEVVLSLDADLTNIKEVDNAENQVPKTKNGGNQTPAKVKDTDTFLFNLLVQPFI